MRSKLDSMAWLAILSALAVATLRLGHFFQLAGLSALTGWATALTLTGGQVYAASRLAAGTASPWTLRSSWVLSIISVTWLGAADVVVGLSGHAPVIVLSAAYIAANPVLWTTGLLAVLPLEIMAAAGGRGLADSDRATDELARADDELLTIARQRNEAEKREERLLELLEQTALRATAQEPIPTAQSPTATAQSPTATAQGPTATAQSPTATAQDPTATAQRAELAPWRCTACGASGSKPQPPDRRQKGYAGHRKSCPARTDELRS